MSDQVEIERCNKLYNEIFHSNTQKNTPIVFEFEPSVDCSIRTHEIQESESVNFDISNANIEIASNQANDTGEEGAPDVLTNEVRDDLALDELIVINVINTDEENVNNENELVLENVSSVENVFTNESCTITEIASVDRELTNENSSNEKSSMESGLISESSTNLTHINNKNSQSTLEEEISNSFDITDLFSVDYEDKLIPTRVKDTKKVIFLKENKLNRIVEAHINFEGFDDRNCDKNKWKVNELEILLSEREKKQKGNSISNTVNQLSNDKCEITSPSDQTMEGQQATNMYSNENLDNTLDAELVDDYEEFVTKRGSASLELINGKKEMSYELKTYGKPASHKKTTGVIKKKIYRPVCDNNGESTRQNSVANGNRNITNGKDIDNNTVMVNSTGSPELSITPDKMYTANIANESQGTIGESNNSLTKQPAYVLKVDTINTVNEPKGKNNNTIKTVKKTQRKNDRSKKSLTKQPGDVIKPKVEEEQQSSLQKSETPIKTLAQFLEMERRKSLLLKSLERETKNSASSIQNPKEIDTSTKPMSNQTSDVKPTQSPKQSLVPIGKPITPINNKLAGTVVTDKKPAKLVNQQISTNCKTPNKRKVAFTEIDMFQSTSPAKKQKQLGSTTQNIPDSPSETNRSQQSPIETSNGDGNSKGIRARGRPRKKPVTQMELCKGKPNTEDQDVKQKPVENGEVSVKNCASGKNFNGDQETEIVDRNSCEISKNQLEAQEKMEATTSATTPTLSGPPSKSPRVSTSPHIARSSPRLSRTSQEFEENKETRTNQTTNSPMPKARESSKEQVPKLRKNSASSSMISQDIPKSPKRTKTSSGKKETASTNGFDSSSEDVPNTLQSPVLRSSRKSVPLGPATSNVLESIQSENSALKDPSKPLLSETTSISSPKRRSTGTTSS